MLPDHGCGMTVLRSAGRRLASGLRHIVIRVLERPLGSYHALQAPIFLHDLLVLQWYGSPPWYGFKLVVRRRRCRKGTRSPRGRYSSTVGV
jgi:hypothetical protein